MPIPFVPYCRACRFFHFLVLRRSNSPLLPLPPISQPPSLLKPFRGLPLYRFYHIPPPHLPVFPLCDVLIFSPVIPIFLSNNLAIRRAPSDKINEAISRPSYRFSLFTAITLFLVLPFSRAYRISVLSLSPFCHFAHGFPIAPISPPSLRGRPGNFTAVTGLPVFAFPNSPYGADYQLPI